MSARAFVSCPIFLALLQGPSCHSQHHELSDQNDITQRPGCCGFWGAWPAQQLGYALAETEHGVQGWAVRAASVSACTAAQASSCAGWPAQRTVAADTLKGGGGGNARPCSCMAASSACIFSACPSLKQPPSWSGPALAHHSVVGDATCVSITDTQPWIRCRLEHFRAAAQVPGGVFSARPQGSDSSGPDRGAPSGGPPCSCGSPQKLPAGAHPRSSSLVNFPFPSIPH